MAGRPRAQLEVDLLKQLAVAGAVAGHGGPCRPVALHYFAPSIPARMWTLSTKPKITTKITKPVRSEGKSVAGDFERVNRFVGRRWREAMLDKPRVGFANV